MRLLTAAFALLISSTLATLTLAATARPVAQFQDWSAYVHESGGKRLCFVASEPKSTLPKGVNRGQILFYISSWASSDVRNEISVKIGYPFDATKAPQIIIGDKTIAMFATKDKAFVADTVMERALVAAMKAGSSMTVTGVSTRGTNTKDQYSLAGITAALGRMAQDCP